MNPPRFDPWHAQWRLLAANRFERWRAAPAPAVFNALALAALIGVLGLMLARSSVAVADALVSALHTRGAWIALALAVGFALRQGARVAALRARLRSDWLAAQPVPELVVQRRLRQRAAADATLHAFGVLALAGWFEAGTSATLMLMFAVIAGWSAAQPLSRQLARRQRTRARAGSRLRDAGRGRLWRWQWIESGAALRGQRLAFGVWALLLVPMGSGPATVIGVGVTGLLVAMLATAWSRSLAVLPQAQRWLDPQPLDARTLLRATMTVPLLLLLVVALLLAASLAALGTHALAMGVAAGALMAGTLQYACVAASRRTPARASLTLLLHAVLLLAMAQAVPPLAPLLWLGQLAWLLRRAVRA